jgi:sec-independent protein translocase protein TatA
MGDLLQPWHLILIAIVALIFFGPRKLPELGKGLGEGWRGFRDGLKGGTDEAAKPANPVESTHAVTPKPDETPKA